MQRSKILIVILGVLVLGLVACQKVTEVYEKLDRPYFGIADAYKQVHFSPAAESRIIPVATNIDTAEWKNRITHSPLADWCNIVHWEGQLELTVAANTSYNRADTVSVTTTKGQSLSFQVLQEGPLGNPPEE